MLQDIPLMQSASTKSTIVWQFPSFPHHLINPGSPPTSAFSNIFTNKHLGLGCHAKNVETLVALDPYSGGRGSWRGSEGRVCLCELLELGSGKCGRHLDRRHLDGGTMEGPETKAAPPKPHIYCCHSSVEYWNTKRPVQRCSATQFMAYSGKDKGDGFYTFYADAHMCWSTNLDRVVYQIELKASQFTPAHLLHPAKASRVACLIRNFF